MEARALLCLRLIQHQAVESELQSFFLFVLSVVKRFLRASSPLPREYKCRHHLIKTLEEAGRSLLQIRVYYT